MHGRTRPPEIGTRYGRLTITAWELRPRPDGRNRMWVSADCDCGGHGDYPLNSLKSGTTKSCGCIHHEVVSQPRTHGGATAENKGRLYQCWKAMRQRCNNPRSRHWPWYGGRGISIHPEWNDFAVFRDWALANGYADDLTLERIHPDGNYEEANCEWITGAENARRARLHEAKKKRDAPKDTPL